MLIYHIVLPETWEQVNDREFYEAESLETEGFIHCSFRDQLDQVLERYYSGVEKVLVLEIDTEKLISKLVVEPSTDDEDYPHIYGKINREAIVKAKLRKLGSISGNQLD